MARHTRSGVAGHVNVLPADRPQRVNDRVDDGWRPADRAELANAFGPEWIDLAGLRLVGRRGEVRQVIGAWYAIIHERAGHELAALCVVARVLEHGLADCLRDAAMHLPCHDQ